MRLGTIAAACTGFLVAVVAGSGPLNPPAGPIAATGATLEAVMAAVVGLQQTLNHSPETAPSLLPARALTQPMELSMRIWPSEEPQGSAPVLGFRMETATQPGAPLPNQLLIVSVDGHDAIIAGLGNYGVIDTHLGYSIEGYFQERKFNTVRRADGTVNLIQEITFRGATVVPRP